MGYSGSLKSLYGYGDFYWGPSVDGYIIRGLPSKEFERGAFSSVCKCCEMKDIASCRSVVSTYQLKISMLMYPKGAVVNEPRGQRR
jgi:hypothetical protein